MATKYSAGEPIKNIIKQLEQVQAISGCRPYQVFEDWLDVVLVTLEAIPNHAKNLADSGQWADDTPETKKQWNHIAKKYTAPTPGGGDKSKQVFGFFAKAFGILLNSSHPIQSWDHGTMDEYGVGGPDLIGQIYMTWAYSRPGLGQYFTPWNVSLLMAKMLMTDAEKDLHSRLKTAAEKHADDPLVAGTMITSLALPDDPNVARDYFYNRVLPVLAPLAEPITACDPCIGSGIMMLALASQYPQWALNWGLIQFYGGDIDATCVKMSKINFILYGLTNHWLKAAYEMTAFEIKNVIPQPWRPYYTEAKEVYQDGNHQRVVDLAEEIHRYKQAGMFCPADLAEVA